MSQHTIQERVIALAGIFQASALVQQVARQGRADADAFKRTIESILITEAAETAEIYGGVSGVELGLKTILQQVSSKTPLDMEITRYALNLMHLERKLVKQPKLMEKLGNGVEAAIAQAAHFTTTHENVLARLGGLYSETISVIPPKIIVEGEHGHLSNPDNANKVRALLLAGMRAVILWRQCGGTRLQLLFQRKNLQQTTRQLLSQL